MSSTTAWTSRIDQQAMSPAELAGLMDREADRFDALMFTATPREELDGLGTSQRLLDQAFVHRARMVVALHNRRAREQREFAVDEIALAVCMSPTAATNLLMMCLDLAALPGMLEAIDGGLLSWQHASSVVRELNNVVLTAEQRAAIGYVVLHRAPGRTPGELITLTKKLILQVDLPAAMDREAEATRRRRVLFYPAEDGQAVMQLRGPVADIAAIEAALKQAKGDDPKPEGMTTDQWEYQLIVQLLTGEIRPGAWQAQIITPFRAAIDSGELELAEIPGYGPILPSTARQLLEDAEWTQVAVDTDGVVIAVGEPIPAPRAAAPNTAPTPAEPAFPAAPTATPSAAKTRMRENWELSLAQLMSQPPMQRLMPEQLSSAAYVTPSRLKRYLQARDHNIG